MSFFQNSCFKALYKGNNDQLLSRSTQDKAFYKKIKKNKGNAIFNTSAQNTVEICPLDFLKVATFEHFAKKAMTSSFSGGCSTKPYTSKLLN